MKKQYLAPQVEKNFLTLLTHLCAGSGTPVGGYTPVGDATTE